MASFHYKNFSIEMSKGFFTIKKKEVFTNQDGVERTLYKPIAYSVPLGSLIERIVTLEVEHEMSLITEPEKANLYAFSKNCVKAISELKKFLTTNAALDVETIEAEYFKKLSLEYEFIPKAKPLVLEEKTGPIETTEEVEEE